MYYTDSFNKEINKINKDINTLFIGDSYFELLNYEDYLGFDFKKEFENALSLGAGGSTFSFWNTLIDKINDNENINLIYINLGVNDINGDINYSFAEMKNNLNILINKINNKFKNAKLKILTIIHTPLCKTNLSREKEWNEYLIKNYDVINVASIFDKNKNYNLFLDDGLHPNKKGYGYLIKALKEFKNGYFR